MIESKSPTRVSLVGGGTDISPYPEKRGGCVISTTINKYVTCTLSPSASRTTTIKCNEGEARLVRAVLKTLKKNGNITVRSDIAPRSGLGNSATATVSLLGLFVSGKPKNEIAELAYRIEKNVLKNRGGKQDQYAAVFGGLNFIEFNGDTNVKITPLKIKNKKELERNLLLVNVGQRTNSGDIIKTYNYVEEFLDTTKKITLQMKKHLERGSLSRVGELLHDAWECKKLFTPNMTNDRLDAIYEAATNNGASGGKIQGAGGGGHMLFYCNDKQRVKKNISKFGVSIVDFKFEKKGLVVREKV